MTPDRWRQIKEILEPAAELIGAERASFVADKCGSNRQLHEEIDALLDAEADATDLLEQDLFAEFSQNESRSRVGERIGKYEITAELGTGGMGSVYLASRTDVGFEQTVALKLIKRGMDSNAILRRFLIERQILASLQHPNIAHLIDGGTTEDGLPYFVMEYVSGESIVDFAASRNLGISERLDLFRNVCSAVSYAHQNLVIHRDLKPSNILINSSGVPKLLDFGIAKLLKAENSGDTATQHFIFTPEYASPEQIRGENLTTTTDVYSLGVILYELLTGVRPFLFEHKNFGQIVTEATEAEPVRPSTVNQRITNSHAAEHSNAEAKTTFSSSDIRGDLDTIILKALKKDPDRRYSSVEQFSEDIRRHLRGQRVSARPDTFKYRAETFTRRNPLLVGAIAAAFLILIAGITATALFARSAEIERQKAERRFNDVRGIANSLIFEVNEKIDVSPIKARELLVTRAIEYLDKLAHEAEGDVGLQSELAASYEKIGDVQAFHFGSGIGDIAGALLNHQKALSIRENLALTAPENGRFKLDIANSYLRIADLSVTAGKTQSALENYVRAVETIETASRINPKDTATKRELAKAYAKLGQGILRSGSISRALENYEKALSLAKDITNADPSNTRLHHSVAVYESYTGYAKLEMGRIEESLPHFMEALRIDQAIWQTDQESLENRRNLANAEQWAGFANRVLQRFDESRQHFERSINIHEKLHRLDPSNVGDTNSLADAHLEMGAMLNEAGKAEAAINYLNKAVQLYSSVAKTDSNNVSALKQIAFTRRHLGDAFIVNGNRRDAILAYTSALREIESLIAKDSKNSEFQYDQAVCYSRLAQYGTEKLTNVNEAIRILDSLLAESPERSQWQKELERAKNLRLRNGIDLLADARANGL